MFTAYPQVLEYLFLQLPMYSRIGAAAYKENLDNTLAICKILGNPERGQKLIHIAGTNGKGSTSHILAAILQCAGYKTGLYTSPHLKDFRERIRINGEKISESYILDFVNQYRQLFEAIAPSFFEWTVGLCFQYFKDEKTDIAIIETGLGGRLDSTNVISPILSVITNIGFDHTDILGDTLPKIAGEKAGIIKPKVPVLIGETHSETQDVFLASAERNHSAITFADQTYKPERLARNGNRLICNVYKDGKLVYGELESELKGNYQLKNICTVLAAIDQLRLQGFTITNEAVYKGFTNVMKLTGLRGRWDVLQQNPLVVADIAHNKHGIEEVLLAVKQYHYDNLHIVIGFVKEKDINSVLKLLPKEAKYYFTQPAIPRQLPVDVLEQAANKVGLIGMPYANVNLALEAALSYSRPDDMILICGSNFVIADLDRLN